MIYLFTGTPGSGKSLHAARLILNSLRYAKKPVIANFPINPDTKGIENFHYRSNFDMTPEWLEQFARDYWGKRKVREDTISLFIDEAQLVFNSRNWNHKDRYAWIEFLSQHRHYGYRVFFMCQFDRMIDRQIRCLCEYEWQHRKMGNYGLKGKIAKLLLFGELFVCVKVFYGLKDKIGQEFFRGKKKYFRLYDSYSTFRRIGDGEDGGAAGSPPPNLADADEWAEPDIEPQSYDLTTLFKRAVEHVMRFLGHDEPHVKRE